MYDKKSMYNVLTLLDENKEHRNPENFLEGLDYKENFQKLYDILNFIEESGEEPEIIECYDSESNDELVKTFRKLIISNNKNIMKLLNEKKDSLDITVNNKKSYIEIILNKNYKEE